MIGKLIDRYMWVADLLIITVFTAFLAAGVDHFLTEAIDRLIRGAVEDPAEVKSGKQPKISPYLRSKATDQFKPVDGTDILRRNIFDSETGPLDGVEDLTEQILTQTPEEAAGFEDGVMIPMCTNPLILQATYASPDYPDYSFVSVLADGKSSILHEGEMVLSYTVTHITWRYAILRQPTGGECYLDIWKEQMAVPAPVAMNDAMQSAIDDAGVAGAKGPAEFQAMLDKSIRDISPNEKDIDASLIQYLVENKHMLMQSGRVLPNVEGDQINGFKVYGIRKTSLWGKLGIHNGDVITSVNGSPMDGPDKAYDAFATLGGSNLMTVEVMRHGKPETFTFNIK